MADTRAQLEAETWVRSEWLRDRYRQAFRGQKVRLASGGHFNFDAVSEDGLTVATISTGGASTASGARAVGKLLKIRSDMFFLMLADARVRLVVLTERDMYDLCEGERKRGRVPKAIEFLHAPLPADLAARVQIARRVASQEVSPRP
jgi:hypothetical protein